jgi:hypothetical protein
MFAGAAQPIASETTITDAKTLIILIPIDLLLFV